MKTISGNTREEVWAEAVQYLLHKAIGQQEYNLILQVSSPASTNGRSKFIMTEFNKLLLANGKYPINTVAETIFPAAEYKKLGSKGVFEKYPELIYPAIKCGNGNRNGTYAYRIVRGLDAKGEKCNPLKAVLDRMRKQLKLSNGNRCAYDISLEEVEAVPINRNDSHLRGFPCLSHLSFTLNNDRTEVHLTAMYRSSNYIEKTLGNLLGLARLQSFVSKELGIRSGELICHSVLARLDKHTGLGSQTIERFLQSVKEYQHERG